MLKEYLSEAVSLLTEAVLGKPVQARASCWQTGYDCVGLCNHCGVGKRQIGTEYCCAVGGCYCDWYTCDWC